MLQVFRRKAANLAAFGQLQCLRAETAGDDHAARAAFHGLGGAQPDIEGLDDLLADGFLVVFAFDKIGAAVEALLDAGNQVDAVAIHGLLGLDTVAKQAQQVGDALFKAFALLGAAVAFIEVEKFGALALGDFFGLRCALVFSFDSQQAGCDFMVFADDGRVGLSERQNGFATA